LKSWLGVYRDPWFGQVSICRNDAVVQFVAAKSPRLTGNVMQVGERLLVDWSDESVDAEPWLEFAQREDVISLTMSKVDPDADFSYDYEDLSFTRVGECTIAPIEERGNARQGH
jgi:hypothetical protein